MQLSDHGFAQYTKEEIIELIKQYYSTHGKIVIRDLKHKNNLPSVNQVIKIFGSFQQCLIDSGIGVDDFSDGRFNREILSKEEILTRYKLFVENHLKTHLFLPTNDDIDNESTLPVCSTLCGKFGSIEQLNNEIGYDQKAFNNHRLECDMIFKYRNACESFNHILNSREITNLSKSGYDIYSMESYSNHFNGLSELQKQCDFIPTKIGKTITKADSLVALKRLQLILGRTPIITDLKLYDFVPSGKYYISNFGSFEKAKELAGLDARKIFKTKNGTRCNSTYELKIAQVLEHYDIQYDNEIYYKDVIYGFNKRYRFDFVLHIDDFDYYIEMFGIIGNDFYDQKTQEKIKICNDNHILLIPIYQEDIYGKTVDEIYQLLMDYIRKLHIDKVA